MSMGYTDILATYPTHPLPQTPKSNYKFYLPIPAHPNSKSHAPSPRLPMPITTQRPTTDPPGSNALSLPPPHHLTMTLPLLPTTFTVIEILRTRKAQFLASPTLTRLQRIIGTEIFSIFTTIAGKQVEDPAGLSVRELLTALEIALASMMQKYTDDLGGGEARAGAKMEEGSSKSASMEPGYGGRKEEEEGVEDMDIQGAEARLQAAKDTLRLAGINGTDTARRQALVKDVAAKRDVVRRVRARVAQRCTETQESDTQGVKRLTLSYAANLIPRTTVQGSLPPTRLGARRKRGSMSRILRLKIRVPDAYFGSARYVKVLKSCYNIEPYNKPKAHDTPKEQDGMNVEDEHVQDMMEVEQESTHQDNEPSSLSSPPMDPNIPSLPTPTSGTENQANKKRKLIDIIYTTHNPHYRTSSSPTTSTSTSTTSTTSTQLTPSPLLPTPSLPPFPPPPPHHLPHFTNGVQIALSNLHDDHMLSPTLPLLDLVAELEDDKPIVPDDDYRRHVLNGAEWVYAAVRGMCEGRVGGVVSLGEVCGVLERWVVEGKE
ncbi:hypothetical protein P280DRAFT_503413 [Massarina eburnea CBS 473.64]|uniref:Uncharacterized protein n=1 Tax=Massarina eburnea CBS 473.64 TaxID=1395130 RepID=A0A6A6SEP9_9PLEO|nr:hypothetical protein P280DRAFT_503413 [Massarina eburnea CBS 473.64]